ncbi:MAG: hypothetical protein H7296_03215 [Bacteroidia bacterium]|nr:hypothetical protein [Bacteroidia bacterium]
MYNSSFFSGITIKDFFPFIQTALTLFIGYIVISIQIRKNSKSRWIEDFRKEVAKLHSLIHLLKNCRKDEDIAKFIETTTMILLMIDRSDCSHTNYIKLLSEVQTFILLEMDGRLDVTGFPSIEKIPDKEINKKLNSYFRMLANGADEIITLEKTKI